MYDEVQMQADIEKYGVYVYEDFAKYMSEEIFDMLGIQYFKISVEKGLLTEEEITILCEYMKNLSL
jgi:hypothetical protein